MAVCNNVSQFALVLLELVKYGQIAQARRTGLFREMKKLTKALLLLCQLASISAASTNMASIKLEKERLIKKLETEKGELYKQIKVAINNSLVVLGKTNDPESILAQKHLKELDKQVKVINETDEFEDGNGRRKYKAVSNYFEINPFGGLKKTTLPPFYRLKVEQDIRDWIAKKKAEQKKIKQFKMRVQLINYEKETCPDFGYNKKKTYKEKGKKKVKRAFPCCRKCCKKSYMGCL